MRNNRNRRGEFGVMLLLFRLLNVGFEVIPPVTLVTVLGQAVLYMGLVDVPWDRWDVCLSAHTVWLGRDWKRLYLSAMEHADDWHLYYNILSFLWKGRSLEIRYGSPNFSILLLFITTLTGCLYVALGIASATVTHDDWYLKTCTIGCSGIIFAMKVITTKETLNTREAETNVLGLPATFGPWIELILIHFLVPNASFMGHLAGILTGVIYVNTPVGPFIDGVIKSITGVPMWHVYSSRGYYRGSGSRFFY